jgi:hypothetical protein
LHQRTLDPFDGSKRRTSGERKHVLALSCIRGGCNNDIAACVDKKQRLWTPWAGPEPPRTHFQSISTATTLRVSHLHMAALVSVEHHWLPGASKRHHVLHGTGVRERCCQNVKNKVVIRTAPEASLLGFGSSSPGATARSFKRLCMFGDSQSREHFPRRQHIANLRGG